MGTMKRQVTYDQQAVWFMLFRFSTGVGVALLVVVIGLLLYAGAEVITPRFLLSAWQHRDITQGGIMPAIVGSLDLGLGVMVVSVPFGVGTAVYLTEYGRSARYRHAISLAIRNLAGVPSVVFGLFGLALFVNGLGFGTSLLSAILTLSAMTLPWIITAAVEALQAVPDRFRESSLALGGTMGQTIYRVVLPAALPGMVTGVVIGVARTVGETAPIIIVGATFFLTKLPTSLFDKFMALPYHAFILSTQHASPSATTYAAGTALVLIFLTSVLSMGAIWVRYIYRRRKDW